jgi:hypothetical protein
MTFTGGPLNELNGKMGISDPKKSVPVMKLIKEHNPKSKEALVQLIEYHKENDCYCGIKSQGSVRDFGINLFNSQIKYWNKIKFTLEECIQWEYDLFVVQSLKGGVLEKSALNILISKYPHLSFKHASGYLDDELRIDIIVENTSGTIMGGIQVKPNTFKNMRFEVQFMQTRQNQKWGNPVWFLYYDKNNLFNNLDELLNKIYLREEELK